MSLSGNLGFVSLDEVLRLLTRSSQQGSVDIRGEQIHGRIFITKSGIGLATTSDDEGLHRHLVKSGLVDDAYLNDVEAGNANLGPIVEKSGGAIVELIREMTVESIYQLGINGETFEVYADARSNYVSPKAFELEDLLSDSKQRLTDWVEVSRIVEDLKAPVAFIRDLGDREEVKIDSEAWKVLSEVGSGASVSQMADELGTTEFWTARIAARLIDEDLVAFAVADEPAAEVTEALGSSESVSGQTADVLIQSDEVDENVDPDQSWWEEPEAEGDEDVAGEDGAGEDNAEDAEVETESPTLQDRLVAAEAQDQVGQDQVAAASSQMPTLSENDETDDVEEDTEAFLEKVFSELETPEEPEEEGYGLLRRRRMGAIRDLSSDT